MTFILYVLDDITSFSLCLLSSYDSVPLIYLSVFMLSHSLEKYHRQSQLRIHWDSYHCHYVWVETPQT